MRSIEIWLAYIEEVWPKDAHLNLDDFYNNLLYHKANEEYCISRYTVHNVVRGRT